MSDRKLYHAEAAAHLGLGSASTWRDYFADGRTPGAVDLGPAKREGHRRRADGVDMTGGHARPFWYAETLDEWKRPQQRGARTDLKERAMRDDGLIAEKVTENFQPRPGQTDTRTFWIAYPPDVAGYGHMEDRVSRARGRGRTRRAALDAARSGSEFQR